jgi:hypothetical protein
MNLKSIESELLCLNETDIAESLYYKFGNPVYLQELDWGITLSKYEFPW